MAPLLALLLSAAGFLCLCAAMKQHQKSLVGRRLGDAAGARLRAAGCALLAAALAVDVLAFAGRGVIYWFGHLTLGAIVTVAILQIRSAATGSRRARRRS